MILYHFTAPRFLSGIRLEGITRGCTPIDFKGQKAFVYFQQWLTVKKDFIQEWCQGSSLPYDRADCRLTIKIPRNYTRNVFKYEDYSEWLGENKIAYFDKGDLGNFCEDSLDWRIYQGEIPPAWIKKIDYKKKNPGELGSGSGVQVRGDSV